MTKTLTTLSNNTALTRLLRTVGGIMVLIMVWKLASLAAMIALNGLGTGLSVSALLPALSVTMPTVIAAAGTLALGGLVVSGYHSGRGLWAATSIAA